MSARKRWSGVITAALAVLSMSGLESLSAQSGVPYERIRDAASEPESWLTYSGTYDSQRFSSLDQIDRSNVGDLKARWVYQMAGNNVETVPLVVDSVMFVTEPPTRVTALDVRTGRKLWSWSAELRPDLRTIGFPRVNRGVAILDQTLFVGTLDAHLVALDALSGAVRWDVEVADNFTGHSLTLAPLALDGKIIVGTSGGEAGIRGFIDAYDPATGERLWRFWTIPGPGEPGNDTWGGDSWMHGAGATWLTGSYDPELDLLYWGIGNPGPDWNGDVRPGDNLYTCSVVALDPDTGELVWYFQFTPHDTHDWDANQIQILVDLELDGRPRKALATANRNAFYYLLDRETGEFLRGAQYAHQTWADGLAEDGSPLTRPGMEPSEEGTLVYPSLQGATNWPSPSYSPQTELFYVPVREMGAIYFKTEAEYEAGAPYMAGGESALDGDEAYGAIRALDVRTGERRWEFRLLTPPWSGILSTAGGLVFGGSNEGNMFALDAETGVSLWDFQGGGAVRTAPVTFMIDGRQHVAISAGASLFVFGL